MNFEPEAPKSLAEKRTTFLQGKLERYARHVRSPDLPVGGRLIQMTGLTLVAAGCRASIGNRCKIISSATDTIEAEVVGFSDGNLFLMPIGRIHGLSSSARVIPLQQYAEVGVGDELLGRVISGNGEAIDGRGELKYQQHVSLLGPPHQSI